MPDDPHDAPKDETPGERRARLMNLNNEGWHPDKVDKVDEVPPAETSPIEDDPQPKPPPKDLPPPPRPLEADVQAEKNEQAKKK